MLKEFDKSFFEYLIKCLKELNLNKYAEDYEKNVIVDNTIFKLGFKQSPTYTINLQIDEKDLNKTIKYLDSLYETDYELFDNYLEFYNLLIDLINENNQ